MPSTHKALFLLEKYGQFAVREVETYTPGRGELLVEIKAIGLNPLDGKIQDVGIFVQDYPAIIGTDAAGVVKQVGEGVTDFAVGDRVYVGAKDFSIHGVQLLIRYYRLWEGWLTNSHATFQQYAIISADITAKVRLLPVDYTHAYSQGLCDSSHPTSLLRKAPLFQDPI